MKGLCRRYIWHLHNIRILSGLQFYVRTLQTPEMAENNVRAALHGLDSKLVVDSMKTMDQQINESVSNERMIALLAVSFALVALLTTAVGLYGVLAYATAQRTREIGIRMALGAQRMAVVRLVLLDMAKVALIGIAVGPAGVGADGAMVAEPVVRGAAVRSTDVDWLCDGDGRDGDGRRGAAGATGRIDRTNKGFTDGVETMIELKNLERSYKTGHTETWVLRRINLTIREGEFVTVMGPSGAGKSSLLNVLAMLDDQWRGEFYFAEQRVHAMNRKQRAELARRRIGMVFQSYHLLDDLTVAENIDLPLSYKDIPKVGAAGAGCGHARPLQYCGQEGSVSQPALRRPAAVGGDRAGSDSQTRSFAGG